MPNDSFDPAAALVVADASRARMAECLYTPVWYHPLLGVAFAMYTMASWNFRTRPAVASVLVVGALVISFGIMLAYRRITGVALNSAVGPRSRRQLTLTGIAAVVLLLAGWLLSPWPWHLGLLYCVLVVAVITVLGRHYDRVLRDEIRSGVDL